MTDDRYRPDLYAARAEHLRAADRVEYWCHGCGLKWSLTRAQIEAHPTGGPAHRLRDSHLTACGRCGPLPPAQRAPITVAIRWADP